MNTTHETAADLLELANLYPSPHNGQPIRLKQLSDNSFEMFFERTRGLQAADVSYIFSFASMGVFTEHLEFCAKALGHDFSYELHLPKEAELRGEGHVSFGLCQLKWHAHKPDQKLLHALHFRQTSRKKYSAGIGNVLANEIEQIAAGQHMKLEQLNPEQAHQAIWLNQRAVFDDMFDEPVRQELNKWLRYSHEQKEATRDGLSYDCMELNGHVLHYIVEHPGLLRAKGIAPLIKRYYLRTMSDNSDVFFMLAPFSNEQAAFNVGLMIMKIWAHLAAAGFYIHPFGTIMSNHAAHHDFLQLAGVSNESREHNYLVFIFRAGKSVVPINSLRLPVHQHLLLES